MKRKKTMTPKQLKANRKNAKKSTGPKTPEGKARASLNATTHALTARCIVFDDDESIDVYLDNFAELIDEWHPIGHTESSLVQRIAACNWRLNRAYRFEARCVRDARKLARREAESFDAEYRDPPVPDPASIILPDSDDLERLIRYESLIDREFNRTLNQLTRLQGERRKREREDNRDPEDDDLDHLADAIDMLARLKVGQSSQAATKGGIDLNAALAQLVELNALAGQVAARQSASDLESQDAAALAAIADLKSDMFPSSPIPKSAIRNSQFPPVPANRKSETRHGEASGVARVDNRQSDSTPAPIPSAKSAQSAEMPVSSTPDRSTSGKRQSSQAHRAPASQMSNPKSAMQTAANRPSTADSPSDQPQRKSDPSAPPPDPEYGARPPTPRPRWSPPTG